MSYRPRRSVIQIIARVTQVIGENVCGRAWIYATLML
jgi:hypothetical protein